jgi:hypothetical protein
MARPDYSSPRSEYTQLGRNSASLPEYQARPACQRHPGRAKIPPSRLGRLPLRPGRPAFLCPGVGRTPLLLIPASGPLPVARLGRRADRAGSSARLGLRRPCSPAGLPGRLPRLSPGPPSRLRPAAFSRLGGIPPPGWAACPDRASFILRAPVGFSRSSTRLGRIVLFRLGQDGAPLAQAGLSS